MIQYISPLVAKKIESMDLDKNIKEILEELIKIEASYGDNHSVKKQKIKNFRETIIGRMPR